MTPYRTAHGRAAEHEQGRRPPDVDLVPVFIVLWLVSLVRVAIGVRAAENFGAEATLAALAVVVVPYMTCEAAVWWIRCRLDRRRSKRIPVSPNRT